MKKALKALIFTTIGLSLLAAAFSQLQMGLALSWAGIEHFYWWQFFTYVLVGAPSFSFGFFVQLAFNMYILWVFGSFLMERAHPFWVFFLYFGAAFVAGWAALGFPHAILSGNTTSVYAILVAWMMLNPGSQLLLFFTLPFKAHWLIAMLIALTFLIDFSSGNWPHCTSLAASVLFSYLFSLIVFKEQSSFSFLNPFERKILRFLEKKKPHEVYHHSKIYDIKSGEPILDDEQFMDAMLDQISRHGENSLTSKEKKRMKQISKKRSQ